MPKQEKDAAKAAKDMAKKAKGGVNLVLLCDESYSMKGNEEAVISGVNEFVHTFQEHGAKVTLAMFDAHPGEPRCRVKFAGKDAKKVKSLKGEDYAPRGSTPLYDAILETIDATDKALGKKERAFMVILTDGQENASEATADAVAEIVKKREKKGWAFLYLGANHNVQASAQAIGLQKPGAYLSFTSSAKGTATAMRSAAHTHGLSYASSGGDQKQYDAVAAQVASLTGGVLDEDEAAVNAKLGDGIGKS